MTPDTSTQLRNALSLSVPSHGSAVPLRRDASKFIHTFIFIGGWLSLHINTAELSRWQSSRAIALTYDTLFMYLMKLFRKPEKYQSGFVVDAKAWRGVCRLMANRSFAKLFKHRRENVPLVGVLRDAPETYALQSIVSKGGLPSDFLYTETVLRTLVRANGLVPRDILSTIWFLPVDSWAIHCAAQLHVNMLCGVTVFDDLREATRLQLNVASSPFHNIFRNCCLDVRRAYDNDAFDVLGMSEHDSATLFDALTMAKYFASGRI